jgi:hypothetical protein
MKGGRSPARAGLRGLSLVFCATFAVTVALAPPSNGLTRPGTIRITDHEIKHTRVDLGERGPSAGDLDVGRSLLYNKGITPKPIGHSELLCTATGNKTSNCSGTYFLPNGRIVAGGIIGSNLIYELAVLGGTGIYDNVRGTLTVTSLGHGQNLLVFRLVV